MGMTLNVLKVIRGLCALFTCITDTVKSQKLKKTFYNMPISIH